MRPTSDDVRCHPWLSSTIFRFLPPAPSIVVALFRFTLSTKLFRLPLSSVALFLISSCRDDVLCRFARSSNNVAMLFVFLKLCNGFSTLISSHGSYAHCGFVGSMA